MAQTAKKSEPKLVDPDKISEVVSEAAPEIAVPQELEGEKVADTLIRARQQYGQDLRSIAQVLCIRYSYLDAIERANYENLPGATYAVGFVRTYAEFLGLDGDAIVERFKNEVQGLDGQTKLHFPTPAPEGKMPGGAVFLVAALLFAGAYGVWFYLSNKGETISDLVSPVPERLQELVTEEPPAEAPAAAAVASASPAATETESPAAGDSPDSAAPSVEAAPAAVSSSNESAQTADPAAPASAPAEAAASQPAPAAPEAAETASSTADTAAAAAPQQSAVLPVAPSASADSSAALANEAPQSSPVVTFEQAEPPLSATPAPETTPSGETGGAGTPGTGSSQTAYAIPAPPANGQPSSFLLNQEPQVYGGDNADARIVLKANQDAWVQVRDREGTLLLTRVLRVGDSYRVPNQEDLTLLTGNAGGLEILVDGTPMAPLGPVGAVRRNVPLDPEQLLSGDGR